jgi:hypothetical protein
MYGARQLDETDLGALFRSLCNSYGNEKTSETTLNCISGIKITVPINVKTTAISALCSGN